MNTLIKAEEIVNTGIFRPAPVTARFDINIISPHVADSEERFVVPVLGINLYDDMVLNQNTAISNYNPDVGAIVQKFPLFPFYETLWTKYLMRYVANCVFYESLPFIVLQVSSKGMFVNNSEFAQNGGVQGAKFMQDTILQRIDSQKELILDYLCKNKADFPLFDSEKKCPCNNEEECGACDCNCGILGGCERCNKVYKNNKLNILFY
jgi:hypothetical protein